MHGITYHMDRLSPAEAVALLAGFRGPELRNGKGDAHSPINL